MRVCCDHVVSVQLPAWPSLPPFSTICYHTSDGKTFAFLFFLFFATVQTGSFKLYLMITLVKLYILCVHVCVCNHVCVSETV